MLRIWGRANSVNVQKVLWCCEEIALPYERRDAGMAHGVVDTPEYRELNPNGLVPTIDDDGFVLWESQAIVRYLAARHASGSLWPDDAHTRAVADQWMDWNVSTLWPALRPLFLGLVRTAPEQRDTAVLAAAHAQTAKVLTILDGALATHPYSAGDAFTVADIVLGCSVWRWMALPIERPALTHLAQWFERLAARAACQRIVMHPLS
jgi:glutathione S-transferase